MRFLGGKREKINTTAKSKMLRPAFLDARRESCLRRRSGSRSDDLVRSDPKTNDKDKGKDAAVAEMLLGGEADFSTALLTMTP